MKESLQLLQIHSSGLADRKIINKTDEDIYNEALKLKECCDKVAYLRDLISEKVTGFQKSKRLLATLTKKCDKEFACKLAQSLCYESPLNSKNYILFAEIAIEHKAWETAKSALEAAIWLCNNDISEIRHIKHLSDVIKSNLIIGKDTTTSHFWNDKQIEKSWIMERISQLYNKATVKEYAFSLLETYSNSQANYDAVFNIFIKYEDKHLNLEYLNYLTNKSNLSKKIKELYSGLLFYELDEYDKSIDLLKSYISSNTKNNSIPLFYLALNYLVINDLENHNQTFNKIIPGYTPEFTALYFINCALNKIPINENLFGSKKNVSYEISRIIRKLSNIKATDFAFDILYKLQGNACNETTELTKAHLAEYYIKQENIELAKKFIETCTHNEAHRLKAWILRIENNTDGAEDELVTYRKNQSFNSNETPKLELINLQLPYNIPNNKSDITKLLENAYAEAKEVIKNLDIEYGINSSTCIEAQCQDCCKKSVPYISYIEYLYLKEWLDKQDKEFKDKIKNESNKIAIRYTEKYKKPPPFIKVENINSDKSYPPDFIFECPFLGENKCNAYEARPFMCRAYGSGSIDGRSFKGCNYFFTQLIASSALSNTRKVLNIGSFNEFAKKADLSLIGESVIAPIPFWFTEEHDKIVARIKKIFYAAK